ncbi:MAG: prepilin-type N-terminal cleavage/methylation domain-containing protein [Candidatus Moraniibacteriota bacterium]
MSVSEKKLKGMTLLEMLIAIAVALIVMEGFTYMFLKTWDTNKFILEEGLASAAASRATNQIVIQLRGVQQSDNGSYAIVSADDFDFTLYADVDDDGVVERVHYFLDQVNDQLKVGVTDPDTTVVPVTYPAGDTTVTVMTNYVVNEATDPVFSYYNDDYPGDTINNPLTTPASVGNIQLIKIHLFVNINPIHAPDNINIESFVDLRNLHL